MPETAAPFKSVEKSLAESWTSSLGSLLPEQPASPPPAQPTATPTTEATNGEPGPNDGDPQRTPDAANGGTATVPKTEPAAQTTQTPTETAPSTETKQPVEPEAKTETEPAEVKTDGPESEKWPRSAADWKKAREKWGGERTALQKEIETLKSQIKQVAEKPAEQTAPSPEVELTKAELERVKKENEEYSKRLQVLDVTKHPKFEQYFAGKVQTQVELAKRLVGTDKAADIEEILKMSDGQWKNERLEGFLADLTPLVNTRIGGILNNLEAIESEKTEAIAQAKTEREKWQTEQTAAQKKAKESVEQTWKSVVSEFQDPKNGLAVYQVRENDTDWNNSILDRVNLAKKLVQPGNDPAVIAKAALHAAAFPAILQYAQKADAAHQAAVQAKDTEIASLKSQVAKLSAAQPAVPGAGKTPSAGEKVPIKKVASHDPIALARDWTRSLIEASQ